MCRRLDKRMDSEDQFFPSKSKYNKNIKHTLTFMCKIFYNGKGLTQIHSDKWVTNCITDRYLQVVHKELTYLLILHFTLITVIFNVGYSATLTLYSTSKVKG